MKYLKKTVVVLSVISYIVIFFYLLFAMPMLWGDVPLPITDNHILGDEFPTGSMFYYHSVDVSQMQKGYVAVYKDASGKKAGLIQSNENGLIHIYQADIDVPCENVLGINKTATFPVIGYFFSFMQGNVAAIIIIGIILAARIAFIYINTDKPKDEIADEYENSLKQMVEEKHSSVPTKKQNLDSIFNTVKVDLPDIDTNNTTEEKEFPPTVEVETDYEKKVVSDNASITDYINSLTFDSLDDKWYSASQVDSALDMITAKIYDLQASHELEKNIKYDTETLRKEKTDLEKKCLTLETEVMECKEKLSEYSDKLEQANKKIENFKVMESKVAQLLMAIKGEKNA